MTNAVSHPGGPHKAALLLLALDEDLAADILRHFSEDDLKRLAECAGALDRKMVSFLDSTFDEFEKLMQSPAPLVASKASDYFRGLAERAFGAEQAQLMLAPPPVMQKPIELIRAAKTTAVADLLVEEHPQVAAVIISQLAQGQAAGVLGVFPPERQVDIVARIAQLKDVPADTVEIASEALAKALAGAGAEPGARADFNGLGFAAGLLNELSGDTSTRILDEMQERFSEITPKLRDAMFTFEDLSRISTRGMQALMREVPQDQVLIALKTASESLRELFLSAVSSRAAESMREDLASMAPMRLSEVEKAQRVVVECALKLAQDGKIQLPRSASERLV